MKAEVYRTLIYAPRCIVDVPKTHIYTCRCHISYIECVHFSTI